MITSSKIRRLAADGDSDRLLAAVLQNGRPLPIEARLRCAAPESTDRVALALGLQRLVELDITFGEDCRAVLQLLLETQNASGGFETACADATALRALMMAFASHGFCTADRDSAQIAIDRATHALFCRSEAWRHRPLLSADDELDAAVVVWQLIEFADLRSLLGLEELESRLRGAGETCEAALAVLSNTGGIPHMKAAA